MRQLWVLRHAKAASHSDDDRGRPLAERGRRQCAELAAELRASGIALPELTVSSPAVRARQTAELVLGGLDLSSPLETDGELYGADPDDVISRARLFDDELARIMVVGHNPTFEGLVLLLLASSDTAGRSRIDAGMPTCALAVVELPIDRWGELVTGEGTLQALFTPTGR